MRSARNSRTIATRWRSISCSITSAGFIRRLALSRPWLRDLWIRSGRWRRLLPCSPRGNFLPFADLTRNRMPKFQTDALPAGLTPDGSLEDPRPAASLFRQQGKGAVPVLRRRTVPVADNSRLIEIVEQLQRTGLVGAAAALDRRQRAVPVTVAIARQHLDRQGAQPLEAAGLRGVLSPGDGVDHLRLLLALDHDEIELEDREAVLDRERGFGAGDDRKSILLGLSLEARGQVDAVAEHGIIEAQVGPHIADHAEPGIEPDADIDRDIGVTALLGLELALLVQLVDPLQHVDRGFAGIELMLLVVERRVPERHDGVAHIFVDGALARQDRIG